DLFLTYFDQMARKRWEALCGGTYITRLAWLLEVFRPDPRTPATCAHLPIDLTIMIRMGLVQRTVGGDFSLTIPLEPQVAPQAETPVPEEYDIEELELEGSAADPVDLGVAPMDSDPRTPAGPSTIPTLQSL